MTAHERLDAIVARIVKECPQRPSASPEPGEAKPKQQPRKERKQPDVEQRSGLFFF